MRWFILFFCSLALLADGFAGQYLPGFAGKIRGEELAYHAPQPDAPFSLLVRSEDSTRYIEWETATPTEDHLQGQTVTFLMLAGIDVNAGDPRTWRFWVDDHHLFTLSSPADTLVKNLEWRHPGGAKLTFTATEVDKYGDFMGYLFLEMPSAGLSPGKPLRLKVTGETAGSRTWFMVFMYGASDRVSLNAENAVEYGSSGNHQLLRFSVVHYGDPLDAMIYVGDQKFRQTIGFGYGHIRVPVQEITRDTAIHIKIAAGGNPIFDSLFHIQPVPRRTIYLLHHSHVDIGYTHVQHEVEAMQWKNLADAARLAEATRDYPEGARFRWNTEVFWAVDSYLKQASAQDRQALVRAMKNGWISLDGLFANELVSLCESEELLWLMEPARRLAREEGISLVSAMITDIPGWSWGLVPALAHSGVRYLSMGTNSGHRIGNTIKVWGDRPFYWVSPSGEEKVLCWIHEKGYAHFHTGLDYRKIRTRLQEELVFDYLNELAAGDYPYEMVMLRYTIGSDNGPVDEYLPDAVKAWNEKYITPKIRISTVEEAFGLFEERYGPSLPEARGDFTAYWEDGAYSTARETVLNRASAARLNQAQFLRSIYGTGDYPTEAFQQAWKYVLLFDEHTWGSWNSISEPESEFTRAQWAIKESFARKAHILSANLFAGAFPEIGPSDLPLEAFEVINTCSWSRSGLVTLPADVLPPNPVIRDGEGNILPTQLLSDGQYVFLAREVPPLGSSVYKAEPGKSLFRLPPPDGPGPVLENPSFRVDIDPATGAIRELTWKATGIDLADLSKWSGINEYVYVRGRSPENAERTERARITRGESGPVVNSLRIMSMPPGSRSMETEVMLVNGLETVYITNTIDKEKIYAPEAVHFAFPLRVPGGVMRYDLAFGHCEVEKDQIQGGNRNFLTMENWIDVSNDHYGVTVACPDAPIFQAGGITMDAVVTGWIEKLEPSQTFFSYAMNNYWETNFAASQEGLVSFGYQVRPHHGFDPVKAEQFGLESRYPLVVVPVGSQRPTLEAKPEGTVALKALTATDPGLILVSLKPSVDGHGLVACLYNPSGQEINIVFNSKKAGFFQTDVDGIKPSDSLTSLVMPPQSIRFVLLVNK